MIGKHPNIIKLVGCCVKGGPFLIVLEYAAYGNLRDFLRCYRSEAYCEILDGKTVAVKLTEQDLVSYAYQVAKGMGYLASRKVRQNSQN